MNDEDFSHKLLSKTEYSLPRLSQDKFLIQFDFWACNEQERMISVGLGWLLKLERDQKVQWGSAQDYQWTKLFWNVLMCHWLLLASQVVMVVKNKLTTWLLWQCYFFPSFMVSPEKRKKKRKIILLVVCQQWTKWPWYKEKGQIQRVAKNIYSIRGWVCDHTND